MNLKLTDVDYSFLCPPKDVNKVTHTDHYIHHGKGSKQVRMIFANQKYEDEENQKLREFELMLEKDKVVLPAGWSQIDTLKAIYAGKFDLKKSLKQLKAHLEWRASPERGFVTPKGLQAMEDGTMYISGRDKQFRPIIIMNIHKVDPKKQDLKDFIEVICFVLDIARKYYFVPGKVENWVIFMEINNAGVFDIPMKVVKALVDVTANNYTACLHKLYIMNPSSFLKRSWFVVKAFVDPETVQKIDFYTKPDFPKLLDEIPREQLEHAYDGTLPPRQVYWPPINTLDPHLYEQEVEQQPRQVSNNITIDKTREPETESIKEMNPVRSQTRQTTNGESIVGYKRQERSDVMSTVTGMQSNAYDTRITEHQYMNKTTEGSKKYSGNGNRILNNDSESNVVDVMATSDDGTQHDQKLEHAKKPENKDEEAGFDEEEEPAFEGTPEQYAMMKWHRKMSKKITTQNDNTDSSPSRDLFVNHGTLSINDDYFEKKRPQKRIPNVTFGGVEVNEMSRIQSGQSIHVGSGADGLLLERGNFLETCGGMCRPRTTTRGRESRDESCNIF